MLKQGRSKLPVDRVLALAQALECDPAHLMRLALAQGLGSSAAKALIKVLGAPVSANELLWLAEIREASGNSDPRPNDRALRTIRLALGRQTKTSIDHCGQ
jgi:hypothetical protein